MRSPPGRQPVLPEVARGRGHTREPTAGAVQGRHRPRAVLRDAGALPARTRRADGGLGEGAREPRCGDEDTPARETQGLTGRAPRIRLVARSGATLATALRGRAGGGGEGSSG